VVDNRVATLRTLQNIVYERARSVVIVSTCRAENEGQTQAKLGWLFEKMSIIRILHFDVHGTKADEIVAEFKQHGANHTDAWDGTLGSLVLLISCKETKANSRIAESSF